MIIRSESFSASLSPTGCTFYALATDPGDDSYWFFRFTGTNAEALKVIATELNNGIRGDLPPEKIKTFKITIEEIPGL